MNLQKIMNRHISCFWAKSSFGTLAAIFCLLYIEPLNPSAARKLVYDHFMYFGEPLAMSLFGFFNAMTASIIYLFGTYGYGCGIVAVFASLYCMTRVLVIYQYFRHWENKEIDHLRSTRQAIKKMIATTGAGEKVGITRSARASRASIGLHT